MLVPARQGLPERRRSSKQDPTRWQINYLILLMSAFSLVIGACFCTLLIILIGIFLIFRRWPGKIGFKINLRNHRGQTFSQECYMSLLDLVARHQKSSIQWLKVSALNPQPDRSKFLPRPPSYFSLLQNQWTQSFEVLAVFPIHLWFETMRPLDV